MQYKLYSSRSFTLFALGLLLGACTTLARAEEVIEFIDIPNRIAWLPAGSDLVLRFFTALSEPMIAHYRMALERIKTIRATIKSLPPAYNSIAMFYDNDIQHPLDKPSHKPGPHKDRSGEAFKAAFETIQKFAGRRVKPYVKH